MIRKSLGEIIDIKHGFAFDGEHIVSGDNGIVLVTPGNFKIGGGFKEEKCKFYCGDIPENYILHSGAYIVTMTDLSKTIDTLGYSAKIPNNSNRIYLHNQRIGLLVFKDDNVCKDYIYYVMQTSDYQKTIANTSTGATVHHTSPTKICNYSVLLPKYSVQLKISHILNCYDELIQNNQKQIKLLEEAAQRLYKKWFVDLHFPGYENTPIINGIPKGWDVDTLGSIAFFKRGKIITSAQVQHGNVPVVAGGLEPAYYHSVANTIAPVITVSGSGANAGFTRLYYEDVFASDCSFVDSQTTPFVFFVYCFVKENKALFDALQKGSAQPHVYANDINSLKAIKPAENIIESFCKVVNPYFDKIRLLNRQISFAQEARDRLLPKLMNGEIGV